MRISDWSSDVCSSDLATGNAAINSPVTGMRLHGVRARGRFSGAQLVMTDFAATAQNGGSVTGTGSFTFMGLAGVGMDLRLQAENAALLERDDIAATVTGPRSEEHTSELQSLMRISYAVFCLKKKNNNTKT